MGSTVTTAVTLAIGENGSTIANCSHSPRTAQAPRTVRPLKRHLTNSTWPITNDSGPVSDSSWWRLTVVRRGSWWLTVKIEVVIASDWCQPLAVGR